MEKATTFACAVILICFFNWEAADATICKPLSSFKIDCNTCFCSRDGARYVCSRKVCRGEPPEFQFINDEGYDDLALPKQSEDKENRIAYVNEDLPSSNEEWDDIPSDNAIDDYVLPARNEAYDPRFVQPIQDVDLDDQEVEDINGLPEDYRFKRDIFI